MIYAHEIHFTGQFSKSMCPAQAKTMLREQNQTELSERRTSVLHDSKGQGAGLLLPYEWLCVLSLLHWKRNPACGWSKSYSAGRNPHFVRSKSAGAARRRKSPQNFRSAGFVYPGSYLLSRDLSSDYHRRADVSLPGSEWDRVGPSGYDHQASALLRTSNFVLRTSVCLVIICACGLCVVCWLPCWQQADIRVACFLRFLQFTHSRYT